MLKPSNSRPEPLHHARRLPGQPRLPLRPAQLRAARHAEVSGRAAARPDAPAPPAAWATRTRRSGSSTSPGPRGRARPSAMLAAALSASGVRTGPVLLAAPAPAGGAVQRSTARGDSPEELVALIEAVRPAVDGARRAATPTPPDRGPTFFEITTAMGLLHFARRQAGAVVLEVGMGGRLDSTNVVRPVLSVITTISFDHTRQLGTTLGAIATEKAGILKRGRPAVSGVREPEARGAIARIAPGGAAACSASSTSISRYRLPAPRRRRSTPPDRRPRLGPDLADRLGRRSTCRCSGPHQAHNAAVALASLDVLAEHGPGRRSRRGRPGLRRAALAGAGRGPRRVALAGHRRRPQRRLGRGAGRDPPDLLPAHAAGPSSSARPATRTCTASSGRLLPLLRRAGRDPLRREPAFGPPRGGRRRDPRTRRPRGRASRADPPRRWRPAHRVSRPRRPDLRDRLALPRRRDPRPDPQE